MSFALLVYASAWFKRYYQAAFCAVLLRAQPMEFYSPQSLVADARRHGVVTRKPHLNLPVPHAPLEPDPGSEGGVTSRLGPAGIARPAKTSPRKSSPNATPPGPAPRSGTSPSACSWTGPWSKRSPPPGCSPTWARTGEPRCGPTGRPRRPGPSTSRASPSATTRPHCRERPRSSSPRPTCGPPASPPTASPSNSLRAHLDRLGAIPAGQLLDVPDGTRIKAGGAVTRKQRPATAGGSTFLHFEDETGMANVIVSVGLLTGVDS